MTDESAALTRDQHAVILNCCVVALFIKEKEVVFIIRLTHQIYGNLFGFSLNGTSTELRSIFYGESKVKAPVRNAGNQT